MAEDRDEIAELLLLLKKQPTVSIPQAGKICGLSRNASYEAARRGEIEVLKFGERFRAPSAPLLRKLGMAG